jgi:hypothetical protein
MERKSQEVNTVFEVTEYKTGDMYEHVYQGYGQKAITEVRKEYPRHSKFVLLGFEFDGIFKPVRI